MVIFVYPAQIIVIYTFIAAYLFATTIFSASIIKLNRRQTKKRNDNHQNDKEYQKNISQCIMKTKSTSQYTGQKEALRF